MSRSVVIRFPWLYIVGCLLILAGVVPALWKWSIPADAQAANVVERDLAYHFQEIETVRVGQRVVTDVAAADRPLKTSVDPTTWKRVTIVAATIDAAGHPDRIVAQTLASPAWLELWEVKLGAKIPFPFDLIEMGIPAEKKNGTGVNSEHDLKRPPSPFLSVFQTLFRLHDIEPEDRFVDC